MEHTSRVNGKRLVGVLALAMVVAACGPDDGAPRATESTVGTKPTDGAALPGERVDIAPSRGARLAVVGVAAGDTLTVRSGPGMDFDVVFELEPLAMHATATGHNRSVGDARFWTELTADGRTGWAEASFLLQPGRVTDITAALFSSPGDRPRADSMRQLGRLVGGLRASHEPPSDVVVVGAPEGSDRAEIIVDVIGLGDDAQGGERLKISADPIRGGESFSVRTVEATAWCSRGVSDDGLCV